jgi:Zn-finger protein
MTFVKSDFEKAQQEKNNSLIKQKSLKKESFEEFFRYENISKSSKDFCPLYAKNQKCHNIEYLNCFFCACPFYMVDNSKTLCAINSRFGKFIGDTLDCSDCFVPHRKGFVKKQLSKFFPKVD